MEAWADDAARAGAALWIPLFAVASCLFAAGFAWVAGPRIRARRACFVTVATPIALSLHTLLLLGAAVAYYRATWLSWVVDGPPGFCPSCGPLHPLVAEGRMAALVGVTLTLALPLSVWAWARVSPRAGTLLRGLSLVTFSAGAIATTIASFDVRRWAGAARTGEIEDGLAAHAAALDVLVWVPAAVAAVGLLGVGVARARSGRSLTTSWRQPALAAAFAALAALAFAATRGHAHDRHHPTSLVRERLPDATPTAPRWVPEEACAEPDIAPLLELSRDGGRLDGRSVSPAELERDLRTYARNWAILHPRELPTGTLLVAAPLEARWPELEPWLAAANVAGYHDIGFVVERPRVVSSDVLGAVPVPAACVIYVRTAPDPGGWVDDAWYLERYPANRWSNLGATLREAAYNDIGFVYLESLGVSE